MPYQLPALAADGATALSSGIDYLRVILSLSLCLALGVAMAFLARRMHRRRITSGDTQLRVLESVRLDARHSLHVVRYGTSHVLVATGASGVAMSPLAPPVDDARPVSTETGTC